METPAPPPESTAVGSRSSIPREPLPAGPLLYLVRLGDAGRVTLVPVARAGDTLPESMTWPGETRDTTFRRRFDSAYLAPGRTLALLSGGERVGSVVLRGRPTVSRAACPSVASGTALLVPGSGLREFALAVPPEAATEELARASVPEADRQIRTFGPILAENLLSQAGVEHTFLAQLADLHAVRFAGSEDPGMAATYLIGDSLAAAPPTRESTALFYLARYEPSKGYVPVWWSVDRYADPGGKRILTFVNWLATPGGRVDYLKEYRSDGVSLVAVREAGGAVRRRSVDWTEPSACAGFDLLAGEGAVASDSTESSAGR